MDNNHQWSRLGRNVLVALYILNMPMLPRRGSCLKIEIRSKPSETFVGSSHDQRLVFD